MFYIFFPPWGKWSNLTNIFSNGFKLPTCSVQEICVAFFAEEKFWGFTLGFRILGDLRMLLFPPGQPWDGGIWRMPFGSWHGTKEILWSLMFQPVGNVIIVLMTSSYMFFFWCVFSIFWTQFWWVSLSRPILMLGCNFCSTREIRTGLKWIFLALGLPGTQQKGVAKKSLWKWSL